MIRMRLPILLTLLSPWACRSALLPEEPEEGPVSTFEFAWGEVDRHYSFFELKGLDWEGIGDFYRPWVTAGTSPGELFDVLSEMLGRLEDGHVSLHSPLGTYRYTGWYQPYLRNFDFDYIWYRELDGRWSTASRKILYGWVRPEIGYIYLPSFTGSGWAGEIDEVLASLAGARALVVDARGNSGGNDENSERIAGRFTTERRLYRRIQYRNGPGHGDFTPLEEHYLPPRGKAPFTGPVAVLTNRRTFSAGERFVLAMRSIPGTIVVGDTTGGGSGNPLYRELPNGWSLSISRWIEWAPDGTTHEGVGLAPDRYAFIPPKLLGLADPILRLAIGHLEGLIGS
jgi:hypothetical protein